MDVFNQNNPTSYFKSLFNQSIPNTETLIHHLSINSIEVCTMH